jgi:hypothetical protein
MTAEPFDTDAYWLGRERDEEWSAPAYWCRECGRAEYIGAPENGCTRCGHTEEAS